MFRNSSLFKIVGVLAGGILLLCVSSNLFAQKRESKDPKQLLLDIYHEVKELGPRENEEFIKREFNFDLDGFTTNREENILVLSHDEGSGNKMILQVTFFSHRKNSEYVRIAQKTQEITCFIKDDVVHVRESTFEDEEAKKMLPSILKGIQDEIRILRMIEQHR